MSLHTHPPTILHVNVSAFVSADGMSATSKTTKRVEKELHQTKVIVRRLPPDYTETKFLQQFGPLPQHNYFYFNPGDPSLGPLGFSRAYINFEDEDAVVPFRDHFDGLSLRSDKGQLCKAIVEFAPYQSIPKRTKRKPDARCGTIDQDADYKTFLESYNSKPEPLPSIELSSYVEELEATKVSEIQKTPLIEYLQKTHPGKSAKSRKNKAYVVETKKRKSGDSKSKSSKERKDWEGGRGTKEVSRSGGEDDRPQERKKRGERHPKDLASKGVSNEGRGLVGNHVASDESMPRGDRQGRVREESGGWRGEGADRGRGDFRDKRRGGEGRRGSSQPENGELGGRDDRPRNKDRPDRALYTPGRGQGRGGGGGPGKQREPRGRSEREGSGTKRDYPSSRYDYGYKKRERGGGREQDGDRSRKPGGTRYQQNDDFGVKRRDREREWNKKPYSDHGGREHYDSGGYDRPKDK